jgi:hypothetical protein
MTGLLLIGSAFGGLSWLGWSHNRRRAERAEADRDDYKDAADSQAKHADELLVELKEVRRERDEALTDNARMLRHARYIMDSRLW